MPARGSSGRTEPTSSLKAAPETYANIPDAALESKQHARW